MPIDPTVTVPVGKTGLTVARFGMGTTTLGGLHAPVTDADARAAVDAALAAGVRHIDTAPQYGTGLAERRLGEALRGRQHSGFVVSTKVGKLVVPKGSGGEPQAMFVGGSGDEIVFDYSYDGAMRSLELSLQRLGLDHVDMLLIHDVTRRHQGDLVGQRFKEAIGGAWKALAKLRAEGTVKAVGIGLAELDWAGRFLAETDMDVMLLPGRYTLLDQTAADGFLDDCRRRGVTVLLAAAFESGILATGAVPGATFLYQPASAEIMARVGRIEAICRLFGVPLAAAALQLPLTHPAIASVVTGMRSAVEVAQNTAWLRHDIPSALWAALVADGILRADLPGVGVSMAPRTPGTWDVAILGGGHNGLVCAAYLAAGGLDVVVLEKNAVAGGAAVTEEFHPGFRNSVAAYTVSLLAPEVIRDLELARHGLSIVERPAANFWPVDDRRALLLPYGLAERQQAIAAFSARDAERLPAYDRALERAAALLRDLARQTPPNVGGGIVELIRHAGLGRRLAGLALADKRLLVDLFTRSAAGYLAGWFENETVQAAFAFDGIVGAYAAPSTPGTAYVLLHHCFGEVNGKPGVWGHAVGGMGAIADAMRRAAEARGVVVRTGAPVRQVATEGDRAVGLMLAGGEVVRARAVAANVPPKLLFRDLLPADAVAPEERARFTAIRSGSGTFRMNVALAELPDFRSRPGREPGPHHGAGIVIGPTLDYLERAYHTARLDGWSREPVVELLIPSSIDRTLAPPGRHVASLFVQHVAPHLPAPRSWQNPDEKAAFAELVIDTVTAHAPNFRAAILGRQVLSPLDLETRFGMVDGDIFHGQLGLDQLFATRPILGHAAYRMPVPGLYLCGSGAHPGGGVTGLPGRNAARELLRDLGRSAH